MQILSESTLDEVRRLLGPVADADYAAARRFGATLDAYCFVAHGEQRDGDLSATAHTGARGVECSSSRSSTTFATTSCHGCRRASATRLSNVVFAYECRDVATTSDMFGGLVTDPLEFDDRIERFAVLTNEGDTLRALGHET